MDWELKVQCPARPWNSTAWTCAPAPRGSYRLHWQPRVRTAPGPVPKSPVYGTGLRAAWQVMERASQSVDIAADTGRLGVLCLLRRNIIDGPEEVGCEFSGRFSGPGGRSGTFVFTAARACGKCVLQFHRLRGAPLASAPNHTSGRAPPNAAPLPNKRDNPPGGRRVVKERGRGGLGRR